MRTGGKISKNFLLVRSFAYIISIVYTESEVVHCDYVCSKCMLWLIRSGYELHYVHAKKHPLIAVIRYHVWYMCYSFIVSMIFIYSCSWILQQFGFMKSPLVIGLFPRSPEYMLPPQWWCWDSHNQPGSNGLSNSNHPTCTTCQIYISKNALCFIWTINIWASCTTDPVHCFKAQSTNVKIVQASVKRLSSGKMEFTAQNQTFVDVTETTANLHYVSSAIQRKWGPEYALVTSDGLKLDDSSGTQGMLFCDSHSKLNFVKCHSISSGAGYYGG